MTAMGKTDAFYLGLLMIIELVQIAIQLVFSPTGSLIAIQIFSGFEFTSGKGYSIQDELFKYRIFDLMKTNLGKKSAKQQLQSNLPKLFDTSQIILHKLLFAGKIKLQYSLLIADPLPGVAVELINYQRIPAASETLDYLITSAGFVNDLDVAGPIFMSKLSNKHPKKYKSLFLTPKLLI